jgi:flagella basal body P-ring formation protein FlgA
MLNRTTILAVTPYALALVALAGVARGQAGGQEAQAVRAELRSDASVLGGEIHLRQVMRWAKADSAFFAPVADVVVGRFEAGQKVVRIDISAVLRTLEGAGVNRSELLVSGATMVEVTRLDAESPSARKAGAQPKRAEKELTLDEFIGQRGGSGSAATPGTPSGTGEQGGGGAGGSDAGRAATSSSGSGVFETASGPVFNVREALYLEAARRVGAHREELELTFEQGSEKVLQLAEPAYKWSIAPGKYRGRGGLGQCSWLVTLTAGEESKKVEVVATVRRWQVQVVTKGGIAAGEAIRDDDIDERRVLVDKPSDEMLLSRETARTMEANQPISGGTILTGRMVRRVMMVKRGQLVSIVLTQGAFQVRSVARALDDGFYGQPIKVKSQETNQEFSVTVTGPQEARLGVPDGTEETK